VSDSPAQRAGGNPDWWKPLEAALALIGGVADDIRNILDEDVEKGSEKSFDVQYLFDQVVPGLLNQTGGLRIRRINANPRPFPPNFRSRHAQVVHHLPLKLVVVLEVSPVSPR
jgi:hypothetical protein